MFDPAKVTYLGTANSGTRICVTYEKSKVKSFKQAMTEKVVLGGVAPIPYRAFKAEAALKGKPIDETTAAAAGLAAVDGARPLSKNGYKVALTQAVVTRALLSLA
jgi:xanthine dehydrogenase YagS FAD-binding subunit